jgi:hypothetical protein
MPLDRTFNLGSKHHQVPDFYLRLFCNTHNNVQIVNKFNEEKNFKSPKSIGAKTDYYTRTLSGGVQSSSTEQMLSKLEGETSKIFQELSTQNLNWPLEPHKFSIVCSYIAFQITRTDSFRDASAFHLASRLNEQGFEIELEGIEQTNLHVYNMAKFSDQYALDLLAKNLYIFCAESDLLVTSDNPVVLVQYLGDLGSDMAPNIPKHSVIFPISPKRLLMFTEEPLDEFMPFELTAGLANEANQLQWLNARSHVYRKA